MRLERFSAMGYRGIPPLDLRRLVKSLRRGRTLARVEMIKGAPEIRDLDSGFVFDIEGYEKPEWIGVQSLEGGPVYGDFWHRSKSRVKELMRRSDLIKVGHNIQGFDLLKLAKEGVEAVEPLRDTMALAGLCEPDMARGLYFQNALYCGDRRPFWKETSAVRNGNSWALRRMEALREAWRATGVMSDDGDEDAWYNAVDCDATRDVFNAQMQRARKEGWI